MQLAINKLDEESKSHAKIEDVRNILEQLNVSEEQDQAAENKDRSTSPEVHPFARDPRPGAHGLSKITKARGVPRVHKPWHTEFTPHNNTELNLWPTSPSSSP